MEDASIAHAGYVTVKGKLGVTKQKKYLAIDERTRTLCICADESSLSNRRMLPLADVERVSLDGATFALHFAEDAAPPNNGGVFAAMAGSEEEAADWVQALQAHIGSRDGPAKASGPRASQKRSAPGAVADLTHFIALGGKLAPSGKLVWIGEGAPPAATPKPRASLAGKVAARLSGGAKQLGKSLAAVTAAKPAGDPKKAQLGALIEKNMLAKSAGGPPKAAAASPRPKPPGRGRLFCFGSKASPAAASAASAAAAERAAAANADAPARQLTKEELKLKIQRQARQAGGGEYLTGGATVGLADDIVNSKLTAKLAGKKAEFERKQAEQAKVAAAKKAEADKAKANQKKQTLDGFLAESGKAKTAARDADQGGAAPAPASPGPDKLSAFLKSSAPADEDDEDDTKA